MISHFLSIYLRNFSQKFIPSPEMAPEMLVDTSNATPTKLSSLAWP
jgi:hypothetical protein